MRKGKQVWGGGCSPAAAKQGGQEEEHACSEGQDSSLNRFSSDSCHPAAVVAAACGAMKRAEKDFGSSQERKSFSFKNELK